MKWLKPTDKSDWKLLAIAVISILFGLWLMFRSVMAQVEQETTLEERVESLEARVLELEGER